MSLILVSWRRVHGGAGREKGSIVDARGSSGAPAFERRRPRWRGAVLAGSLAKDALFTGGAAWVAGDEDLDSEEWEARALVDDRARTARWSFLEGAVKAVAAVRTSTPSATEVVLSGRLARAPGIAGELTILARTVFPHLAVIHPAREVAKEAALGAALLADGLCGGRYAELVEALQIRRASGTTLDHVYLPAAHAGISRFLADSG